MKELEKLGFKKKYNFDEKDGVITFEDNYDSHYFTINVEAVYNKQTHLVDLQACPCHVECCGSSVGRKLTVDKVRDAILDYIQEYIKDHAEYHIFPDILAGRDDEELDILEDKIS